ncbi:MAG: hypothetical protein Q9198_008103, partial [Flavoplaca austrocitrina]
SKIYGLVKKYHGYERDRSDKRAGSGSFYEDDERGTKKARMAKKASETVGLGIEQWERPSQ